MTATVDAGAALATQRAEAAITSDGQYLYVSGGAPPTSSQPALATVERAEVQPDGSLGPWGVITPMTAPRRAHAMALVGGRLLVFGGDAADDGRIATGLDLVEWAPLLPDGLIGAWQADRSLPFGWRGHSAAVIGDSILLAGGTLTTAGSAQVLERGSRRSLIGDLCTNDACHSEALRAAIDQWPAEGVAPLSVGFRDESGAEAESWHWALGTGTASTTPTAGQEYLAVGRYPLSLRVCTATACDIDRRTLVVRELTGSGVEWEQREPSVILERLSDDEVRVRVNIAAREWGEATAAPVVLTIAGPGLEAEAVLEECARATYDEYVSLCWGTEFIVPSAELAEAGNRFVASVETGALEFTPTREITLDLPALPETE